MKHFIIIIMCILFFGCGGKTVFHGLKPIPLKKWDSTTETRPMFKWEASPKKDATYDFIINELVEFGERKMPGKMVYYKEGIKRSELKIDFDLEKGKSYLWSVRLREGDKTEKWSGFDYADPFIQTASYPYTITIIDNDSKPDYMKHLQ